MTGINYSRRKPYLKTKLSRTQFFSAPVRNLRQSRSRESAFEKPYRDPQYNDMHLAPPTPDVPRVEAVGTAGLVCNFYDNACEFGISCLAGAGIRVTGGPQEGEAGYLTPEVVLGSVISSIISGTQDRRIDLTIDEDLSEHVVIIAFVDGWGVSYSETIEISCLPGTAYFDDTNWDLLGYLGSWDGAKWSSEVWPSINTPYVLLFATGTWAAGFRPTKCYVYHTFPAGTDIILRGKSATSYGDMTDLALFSTTAAFSITDIEFYDGSWTSYFDNTKWQADGFGAWNVNKWDSTDDAGTAKIALEPINSWEVNFRPTEVRVTHDGTVSYFNIDSYDGSDFNNITLDIGVYPSVEERGLFFNAYTTIGYDLSHVSGVGISLDFTAGKDIFRFEIDKGASGSETYTITDIRFE